MDRPLRRFNREGERFIRRNEEEQDSIARIAQAKRTAERHGYSVELDRPRIDRPYHSSSMSKLQQAKQVAQDAGYKVKPMSQLDQAKQVAQDAGYNVRPMSRIDQAKQTVQNAGYNVRKISVPQPKNEEPTDTGSEILRAADRFLEI